MDENFPSEVYLAFLDRTIEIHWVYHALLMVGIWFVLVPFGVIAIRFFKPKPTACGIEKGTARLDPKLIWWTVHYGFLYLAIGLVEPCIRSSGLAQSCLAACRLFPPGSGEPTAANTTRSLTPTILQHGVAIISI